MSFYHGPTIVTNGLVLSLDAADRNSYPGSGTTWWDMSGGGRNFTFGASTAAPTFSTDSGGCIVFDGSNDTCNGPASNTFNIAANGDHTVEMVFKPTQAVPGATFKFYATGVEYDRGIFAHTPYSNNSYYYDNGGYSSGTRRVEYSNNLLINTTLHFFFRRKSDVTPYREILRGSSNSVTSLSNSGGNNNENYTLNATNAWIGGGDYEFFKGNIYLFRLYNRALSDVELSQNYNATKSRFGL